MQLFPIIELLRFAHLLSSLFFNVSRKDEALDESSSKVIPKDLDHGMWALLEETLSVCLYIASSGRYKTKGFQTFETKLDHPHTRGGLGHNSLVYGAAYIAGYTDSSE